MQRRAKNNRRASALGLLTRRGVFDSSPGIFRSSLRHVNENSQAEVGCASGHPVVTERPGLAKFGDASHFYDWRLFLPLRKSSGLLMIRIHTSKPLTVIVKQCHLPVVVLAPCVFPE